MPIVLTWRNLDSFIVLLIANSEFNGFAMFSTQTLNALISLAASGCFKDTAAALGISSVKLTRLVQRAEQDCGFKIFDRRRAATVPTNRGQRLLEACRELNLAACCFDERLQAIQGTYRDTFRISCGPLATHTVLQPLLRALFQARPDISATVRVTAHSEPVQQLRDGDFDLFIGDLTHTTSYDDIEVVALERRKVIFAARPDNPILEGGPYSLADLLQQPLALPHIHKYWQFTFDSSLQEAGAPSPKYVPKLETDDYQTLVSLASNTNLLTAGTPEQLEDAIVSGRLAVVPLSEKIQYNICCACRDPHANDSLQWAWTKLKKHYSA